MLEDSELHKVLRCSYSPTMWMTVVVSLCVEGEG